MMKTHIKNCLVLTIFLLSLGSYCQKNETEDLITASKISTYDLRDKNLKGTMYLEDDPKLVKITNNEKMYSMRYNAYQDEMEFERDGTPYYLPKSYNYTITFVETNKVYKVYSYPEKGTTKNGFFVVLFQSAKISLLNKERIKFFEAEKPKTGYDKYKPPTLKRIKDKLYIGFGNNTTSELPTKKKELLKLFSSKAKDVESYAKKNKIGFKKNEDLVQLFNYYNSLK